MWFRIDVEDPGDDKGHGWVHAEEGKRWDDYPAEVVEAIKETTNISNEVQDEVDFSCVSKCPRFELELSFEQIWAIYLISFELNVCV